ncbi:MAG: hypothetical protein D6715_09585 [Calditrichaeota bacterium]|nr:MAG: hypothetical protein D6715_09585 [Calditrichota bacterium]
MSFKSPLILLSLLLVWLGLAGAAATNLEIRKVEILGNHAFSTGHLKSLLNTHKGDKFDIRFIRLDQIRLTNFYQREGFLDVFVSADFKRKGDVVFVQFTIREGRRYFLKAVRFVGNTIVSDEKLRKMIPVQDGQPYRVPLIEEGLNQIEAYYMDHGKPYVILKPERQTVQDSLIILNLNIDENETVFIGEIRIQGLRLAKEYVVRRELQIHPGEVYSKSKIENTQSNIYSTGLFQLVSINLIPSDTSRSVVTLVINVQEKRPAWVGVRFGVSYEQVTDYGGTSGSTFDITLEGGHRNLFGSGRSLNVSAVPSYRFDFTSRSLENLRNKFQMTYVQPWLFILHTPLIVQVFYERVNFARTLARYSSFTGLAKVTHEFSNHWQLTETFSFQDVRTDSLALLPQGQDKVYSVTSTFIRDKRDNFLNPTQGYVLEFQNKLAVSTSRSPVTGGDVQNRFTRMVFQWSRYQPFRLQPRWTLASRIRGGIILDFARNGQIPVLERFYLGGSSSVRGYPERSLGPKEPGDPSVASGGKLMVLGNVELRIPLFWLFYGTVFTDAGNVWRGVGDFRISDIKVSSGSGIALMTPLGPFRFDYGRKWFPEPGEGKGEFHVGISFAF